MEDIISSDGLHMNDVSYGCIARLLADSVAAVAKSDESTVWDSAKGHKLQSEGWQSAGFRAQRDRRETL